MSKTLDTVRLQNIAQGYAQSATLMAAVELGLFGVIERGAGTFDEVAVALDLHPTSAERLIVMCAATGLLERTDGRYHNVPDVARYLVEDSPHYAGAWMLFTKSKWNEWGRPSEHLRAKSLKTLGDIADFSVERAREYHMPRTALGWGRAGGSIDRSI